MAQPQNPKALINQFYQRAKGPPPRYEAVPAPADGAPQRFIGSCTLPTVTVEGETMPEQVFQEEGRSKKAATDAAAATAFAFLAEQPVYGAIRPYEPSLIRTLAARVLSEQGLYRDPEVHGLAVAAAAYHDGWLPLSGLVHSRLLRGWAREYGPGAAGAAEAAGGGGGGGGGGEAANDPALMVDLMRRELAAQAAAEGGPSSGGGGGSELTALGLELAPSGLSVRLAAAAAAAAPPTHLSEQMEAEVVAAGGSAGVVVIPADSSLPLREERLSVRTPLLDGVAALLDCPSPAHVLQWGRVGHKATVARDPRGAVGEAAAAAEAEELEQGAAATEGTGQAGATSAGGGGGAEATGEDGGPAPMDEGTWRLAEAMSTAPGGLVAEQPQPQPQSGENDTPAPGGAGAVAAGTGAAGAAGPSAGPAGSSHARGTAATGGEMRPPAPRRTTSVGSQQSMQLQQPQQPPAHHPHHPHHKTAAATATAAATEGGGWCEDDSTAAISPEPSISAPPTTAGTDHAPRHPRQQVSGSGAAARSAGGAAAGGGGWTTSAGGGGGSGGPLGPPTVVAMAYRVDSTLTLAVHRGAAAMDWDADGNEVRGPERSEVSPTTSTAHRQANAAPSGNAGADSATRTQHQHQHHTHTHQQHTQQPAAAPTSPLASAPTSPRLEGGAGTGGGVGGSSVPAVLHPTSVTLPEPSLYSRLLLPPLPTPTPGAGADTSRAVDAPLLYDPAAAATVTISFDPTTSSSPAAAGAAGTAAASGTGAVVLPSLAGQPLNVRATWLAGRPVFGDAVATTCRQSPTPHVRKGHHVMKWRSYGTDQWWATAAAATPAAALARALHAPLLLRGLPLEFRGPSTWLGPLPRQLLDSYVAAHPQAQAQAQPAGAAAEGQYVGVVGASFQIDVEVPDVDLPGEGVAALRGTNFLGLPYRVTAGPAPLELAVQQVALAALHQLQRMDAACLTDGPSRAAVAQTAAAAANAASGAADAEAGGAGGKGKAAEPESEMQLESAPQVEAQVEVEVEVLEEGLAHARQPREGCMAKVAYSLYLTHGNHHHHHHHHPQQPHQHQPRRATTGPEPSGPTAHAFGGAAAAAAAAKAAAEAAGVADVGSAGALDEQQQQQQQHRDVAMADATAKAVAGNGGGGGGGAPSGSGSPCGSPGGGSSRCVVIEQHAGLTLCVGGGGRGAVPPQLDAALRRLRVGGRARFRLPVYLDGVNPFTQHQQRLISAAPTPAPVTAAAGACVEAVCEVRLLHCSLPVVEGRGYVAGSGGGAALFSPPLSAQRMQAVAAALRREGAQTLVDLGCGDAKLIEGLLLGRHGADAGGPLRRCIGVDISGGALAAGGRRLGRLTAAAAELEGLPVDGEESVPVPVEVALYRGSAMAPLLAAAPAATGGGSNAGPQPPGPLPPGLWCVGCDAAAMVEVVEHLDPQPLALVGPCVLGGLKPRLLLVTTPNWEYNSVLRAAERLAASRAAAATATARNAGGAKAGPVTNGASTENNGGKGDGSGGNRGGLAALPPCSEWPGPPGRDGLPLRCADHRFEWSRAEFRTWAGSLAAEWGYDVSFEDIGSATDEQEAMQLLMEEEGAAAVGAAGDGGVNKDGSSGGGSMEVLALPGSAPGGATQMAIFRRQASEQEQERPSGQQDGGAAAGGLAGPAVGSTALGRSGGGVVQGGATEADTVAAAVAAAVGGGGSGDAGGGSGGTGWELVWGPANVAAPREEFDDLEAAVEAGLGMGATATGGAGGPSGRRGQAPGKRRSSNAAEGSGGGPVGRQGTHGFGRRPLEERAGGAPGPREVAANKRPHLDMQTAAAAVGGQTSTGCDTAAEGGDVDVF